MPTILSPCVEIRNFAARCELTAHYHKVNTAPKTPYKYAKKTSRWVSLKKERKVRDPSSGLSAFLWGTQPRATNVYAMRFCRQRRWWSSACRLHCAPHGTLIPRSAGLFSPIALAPIQSMTPFSSRDGRFKVRPILTHPLKTQPCSISCIGSDLIEGRPSRAVFTPSTPYK